VVLGVRRETNGSRLVAWGILPESQIMGIEGWAEAMLGQANVAKINAHIARAGAGSLPVRWDEGGIFGGVLPVED